MTTNMAGSSEGHSSEKIDLEAVKRQIDEYDFNSSESEEHESEPETKQEEAPKPRQAPARKRRLEEDNDPCRFLVQECSKVKQDIQEVEANIQALEKKIQQLQCTDRLAVLPSRFSEHGNKKKKQLDCQREAEFLKQCISLSMEYTSVKIKTNKWKTVYIDGDTICRKHYMSGTVEDEPFSLEYKLLEPFGPKEDQAAERLVFGFVLEVPEELPNDFTKILQKIVVQYDVQGVVRTLVSYFDWRKEFHQTVKELQRLHPQTVTMEMLEEMLCLMLSSTDADKNLKGRVLMRWELSVNPTFSIEAVPKMAIQLPKSMLDLDESQSLQGLMDNFPHLQKKLGLRKSLEYLISLVSKM